ncbi:mannose-1-phosphate guanyltransferase [Deltaproteobacteria bacterium Smac51]|nr:mannose-1-phosphate guanyltransferase [Deltaproteobacteria bacterium Smac51]
MASDSFSPTRWWGVVLKEFLQLRRDRVTFALIIGLPIAQLLLFGFAINADPKNLPVAIVDPNPSEFSRSLASALNSTGYFKVTRLLESEEDAKRTLLRGRELFVINIPADFTKELVRGHKPDLLVEVDASDPGVSGQSLMAISQMPFIALKRELSGPLLPLAPDSPPFGVQIHRLYNPEGLTRYNMIPSLMGVILTITMVMMTSLALTRERERGTMENMLSMPLKPLEVLSGKMVPYIFIGFIQATIILIAARLFFQVPVAGGLAAVYLATMLYVTTNLAVGITISSLARNQLQAIQMTIMFFMPNLLLSGFLYSVLGEPKWARILSEMLPLTHFNRLIRSIFLKAGDFSDLWPSVWPILLFTVLVMFLADRTYKTTLD